MARDRDQGHSRRLQHATAVREHVLTTAGGQLSGCGAACCAHPWANDLGAHTQLGHPDTAWSPNSVELGLSPTALHLHQLLCCCVCSTGDPLARDGAYGETVSVWGCLVACGFCFQCILKFESQPPSPKTDGNAAKWLACIPGVCVCGGVITGWRCCWQLSPLTGCRCSLVVIAAVL